MKSIPALTIGMPVYNECRFLKQAIDSLLAQDFSDFELVIADNASSDDTPDICEEYAARDKRIRFLRNEINIGSINNFNSVFEHAKGPYFLWAGGHDLWHLSFLSRSIDVLEKDKTVVLCYPLITCIDADGKSINVDPTRLDTRSMGVSSRLNCVIWGLNRCDFIYSVIRTDALRKTRLFRPTLSPDNIIVAELSLIGAIAFLPEPLFFLRSIRKNQNYAEASQFMATYHTSDKKCRLFFPSWRFLGEHVLAIFRAWRHNSISASRIPVLLASVLFGILARRAKHMVHDLILAPGRLLAR